jgi:hypothetical protein
LPPAAVLLIKALRLMKQLPVLQMAAPLALPPKPPG